MQTVQAGLAAIIASALPLWVAAFGRLFLGQRLPPVAVGGAARGLRGGAGHHDRPAGARARLGRRRRLRRRGDGARGGDADAPERRRGRAALDRRGLQMLVGAAALFPASLAFETWHVAFAPRFFVALPLFGGGLGGGGDDDLVRPGAADRRDPGRDLPLSQPVPRGVDRRGGARRAGDRPRPRGVAVIMAGILAVQLARAGER